MTIEAGSRDATVQNTKIGKREGGKKGEKREVVIREKYGPTL